MTACTWCLDESAAFVLANPPRPAIIRLMKALSLLGALLAALCVHAAELNQLTDHIYRSSVEALVIAGAQPITVRED